MKNLKEYIIEGIFDIDDNIDNVDEAVKEQIEKFLKDNFYETSSYKISDNPNKDGKYEVSSSRDIIVENKKITSLTNGMFIWTEVGGNFYCRRCASLKSLEGAPKKVGSDFDCVECKSLTSLEGAPKEIGGDFNCCDCELLVSLKGSPEKVGGNFYCSYCESLASLEGAPKKVSRDFYCRNCRIAFTINDVKKVSNVKGYIIVQ